MSEVSRLFGLVIRMYPEVGAMHHRPYFHATYQGTTVSVGIDVIELIRGQLPDRQRRLVELWADQHRQELLDNWRLLSEGDTPNKIDPLYWGRDS